MRQFIAVAMFVVLLILGLTSLIVGAAPYIAMALVVLGLLVLGANLGSGTEDPPEDGPGPPVVR